MQDYPILSHFCWDMVLQAELIPRIARSHEGQRAPLYGSRGWLGWDAVGMQQRIQYFRTHGEMGWRSGLINYVVKVSRPGTQTKRS